METVQWLMHQHRADRRQLRWLHTASLLMLQGRRQAVSLQSGRGSSQRRWKQRQNLAQKLLESPAEGWTLPKQRGARFWRALRWGGAGFVVAWWLRGG